MPSTSHPQLRVAAIQAAPVFLDLDGTIDKAIRLMQEAARHGARLIAFPETWIPGYPWWIWLDSPAGGMQYVQRYHDHSLVVGSPEFERLAQAAREFRIWVAMGYSEKSGGSLYMGQALFDDQGKVVKTRRKLKPTHVERTVFGEGDGSDLAVMETGIGNSCSARRAVVICSGISDRDVQAGPQFPESRAGTNGSSAASR